MAKAVPVLEPLVPTVCSGAHKEIGFDGFSTNIAMAKQKLAEAGYPDGMAGVDPGMGVGPTTEVTAGEGLILTAGGVDTHIHFICPQQAHEAVASGLTTMLGGGNCSIWQIAGNQNRSRSSGTTFWTVALRAALPSVLYCDP